MVVYVVGLSSNLGPSLHLERELVEGSTWLGLIDGIRLILKLTGSSNQPTCDWASLLLLLLWLWLLLPDSRCPRHIQPIAAKSAKQHERHSAKSERIFAWPACFFDSESHAIRPSMWKQLSRETIKLPWKTLTRLSLWGAPVFVQPVCCVLAQDKLKLKPHFVSPRKQLNWPCRLDTKPSQHRPLSPRCLPISSHSLEAAFRLNHHRYKLSFAFLLYRLSSLDRLHCLTHSECT